MGDILVLSVLAVIAGAEAGRHPRVWPCKGTFSAKVLEATAWHSIGRHNQPRPADAETLSGSRRVYGVGDRTEGTLGVKTIAIDGKSMRRSHDRATARKMLHCVCAWSVENKLVLSEQL